MPETTTAEATKVKTSALGRVGTVVTILAVVAVAVPLLYVLYAKLTGNVSLATKDAISGLLTTGVIITAVALGLGVLATLLNLPGVLRGKGVVSTVLSVLALIVAALFLFMTVLPRVNAVQNLNNNIVPFAQTMRDNCKKPLNQTTVDLTKARDDAAANASSDAAFAGAMQADATTLKADAATLAASLVTLEKTTSPDSKYDALLMDCKTTVAAEHEFLIDDTYINAIPLPKPFSAIQKSVSGITLLGASAQIAAGQSPLGPLPAGTMQPLVAGALTQVLAVKNPKLTAEGDALTQDIKTGLDTNLSPFKVTMPIE